MKKILLSLSLITILSVSTSVSAQFSDVDESTSYKEAIQWLDKQGIIQGYPDGNFRPDNCVNRAEFLKILYTTSEDILSVTSSKSFSDVDPDAWYYEYLITGVNQGLVQGYSDGTFRPSNCINRAEAIKIIINKYDKANILGDIAYVAESFSDLEKGAWYYQVVFNAISQNLVGLNHTTVENQEAKFYPAGPMSRKEVSELIYRTTSIDNNNDYKIAGESFTKCTPVYEDEICDDMEFELVFKNPLSVGDRVTGLLNLKYYENSKLEDVVILNANNKPFFGDGGQLYTYDYEYYSLLNEEMHQIEIKPIQDIYEFKIQDNTFLLSVHNLTDTMYFVQ